MRHLSIHASQSGSVVSGLFLVYGLRAVVSSGYPFAIVATIAIIAGMATLTIRQLDEKTKTRLRIRAAHHGRSMEEEAREILRSALTTSSPAKGNLADAIRRRFAVFGGIELGPVKRDALRDIPGFEE